MKDAVSHVYERVLHSLSRAHARGEDFQITKNDGGRSKRNIGTTKYYQCYCSPISRLHSFDHSDHLGLILFR